MLQQRHTSKRHQSSRGTRSICATAGEGVLLHMLIALAGTRAARWPLPPAVNMLS